MNSIQDAAQRKGKSFDNKIAGPKWSKTVRVRHSNFSLVFLCTRWSVYVSIIISIMTSVLVIMLKIHVCLNYARCLMWLSILDLVPT